MVFIGSVGDITTSNKLINKSSKVNILQDQDIVVWSITVIILVILCKEILVYPLWLSTTI